MVGYGQHDHGENADVQQTVTVGLVVDRIYISKPTNGMLNERKKCGGKICCLEGIVKKCLFNILGEILIFLYRGTQLGCEATIKISQLWFELQKWSSHSNFKSQRLFLAHTVQANKSLE